MSEKTLETPQDNRTPLEYTTDLVRCYLAKSQEPNQDGMVCYSTPWGINPIQGTVSESVRTGELQTLLFELEEIKNGNTTDIPKGWSTLDRLKRIEAGKLDEERSKLPIAQQVYNTQADRNFDKLLKIYGAIHNHRPELLK